MTVLQVVSPTCTPAALLPQGTRPYLLDLLLGHRRHGRRKVRDPTSGTATQPGSAGPVPALHVMRRPACDSSGRWAGRLRSQRSSFAGSSVHVSGCLSLPGTSGAAEFLLWLLVLLKAQKLFRSSASVKLIHLTPSGLRW